MHRQFFWLRHALAVAVSINLLFYHFPAIAAEQVLFKYGIFRESLSVEELSAFAQTGVLSKSLRINLALARQNPKAIRTYLTEPVKVSPVILDRVLNSRVGILILDQITQVIHTPSGKADRQALRSALVLSASKDGQITLIEIIENYPTSEVVIEGERLESAYRQLRLLQETIENLLSLLG
jgi:hypothetical protein